MLLSLHVSITVSFLSLRERISALQVSSLKERVNTWPGPADFHVISAGQRPLWLHGHFWPLPHSVPVAGLLSVRGYRPAPVLSRMVLTWPGRMARGLAARARPVVGTWRQHNLSRAAPWAEPAGLCGGAGPGLAGAAAKQSQAQPRGLVAGCFKSR